METQSPFLPGTKIQYAWDSTCLGALKTCPRLYQYLYIDGWGHTEESTHLRFGREYHQALQYYDLSRATGIPHDDALHDVVRELLIRTADFAPDPETRAGKYKNRNMLVRCVIWYLDEHKDDPAKVYIKVDGKPAVELSFRFELNFGPKNQEYIQELPSQPYLLCGHLDKIVNFTDALFDMDHKTSLTTIGSYYFAQYSPHNQMSLYSIASKVVIHSPVKGVIINAAQLMLDYEKTGDYGARFVRGFTYRTQDQLTEWEHDLSYWLDQSERYAIDNYWPQNDTSCDKFGGCRFRDICSKSPQVREQFLKTDFDKLEEAERWNPLKNRN